MKKSIGLAFLAMLPFSNQAYAASTALAEIVNYSSVDGSYAVIDGLNDAFDGYLSGSSTTNLALSRTVNTLQDIRTYRVLDTWTNASSSTVTGTISYYTNLGSDGWATVSSQTPYSYVTNEAANVSVGWDPAIGFLLGNNAWTAANASIRFHGSPSSPLGLWFDYHYSLGAGQSLTLLSFASLFQDTVDRSTDFQGATSVKDSLFKAPDLRGLTNSQIASIANFNVNAVPVPGAVWLFGSGLMGLIGYSRRKQVQA